MVGVREYYEKDGEALPGKKGISMTIEQFNTIVGLLPEIERELGKGGMVLERPRYGGDDEKKEGGAVAEGDEDGEEEDAVVDEGDDGNDGGCRWGMRGEEV
jgi:hypothetical protein